MQRAKAAVVGLGNSRVFRRADVPLGALAVEACRAAITDAGLSISDIDGITTAPVQPFDGAGDIDGINYVTTGFAIEALGIDPTWSEQGDVMVTQTFLQAANAVAAGACKYALVFRALHNPTGRYGRIDATEAPGAAQFTVPYGLGAVTGIALVEQKYIATYGAKREDLGKFIVRNRQNAMNWEYGYWAQHRPELLTLDDYMTSRMISEPMCIHDCDIPIQGAAAFVLTSAERARDLPHKPAYILGTAVAPTFWRRKSGGPIPPLDQYMAIGRDMAAKLYANAGISREDIDVVNFYDGFSVVTPFWAECFGLCPEGEAFAWVADPDIPLNTSSGNLGAGRMHGCPHLMDGAMQVMGRSGVRQVENARVSVVAIAPNNIGGGVVFSSEPN